MNPRQLATGTLVKLARFMTQGSGDIEKIFQSIDRLGFLWTSIMRAMQALNIDRVIFAPAGSKLVPIPLFMSSSEKSVLDVFKPHPGETVVDVGTYYGRYTLMASQYVGDSGLVVGVEADSNNYSITKKNLENNNVKNAVMLWSAASDHEGTIKLYKTERPGTPSIVWDERSNYETVPCKTLDSLLQESGVRKVDWLKIDVEGAELMVLKGSQRTMAENMELKLVIEIHTSSNSVIDFLEQLGYNVKFLENNGNIPYHILSSKSKQITED